MKKHWIWALGTGLALAPMLAVAQSVRPAVGVPLQKAEALIAKHDDAAALREVQKASEAGSLTPFESVTIAEVRGAACAGAGDALGAAAAYETVLASGSLPAASRLQMIQAIAGFYYSAGKDAQTEQWVNRYIAAGGTDAATRALLAQAYYRQGDFKHAAQAARQASGASATEGSLQLWAVAAQKSGDAAGYWAAQKALLSAYPSADYWRQAIAVLTAAPGFPDRLTLNVYRLRFATGTLDAAADFEDYAERAILAGQPAEAKAVIDKGFAIGVLNDKVDGGHALRLRMLAAKEAAADAQNLTSRVAQAKADPDPSNRIDTGTDLVAQGQAAAGIALIQQTVAQGGLNDPVGAAFSLGIALVEGGSKADAVRAFETVPGYAAPAGQAVSPAGGLAQLWAIFAQNAAKSSS